MQHVILTFVFYVLVIARLISVFISAANERKLKKIGAVEYGKGNSLLLVVAHFAYYIAAVTEGSLQGAFFYDGLSYLGLAIYAFSIVMLYYVIYTIRYVWTVKLIIAPQAHHVINKSPLFKYIKHPNYFLNIIPELIGFALFFHAWITLIAGMIIYLVPLAVRIRQEETVMKAHFSEY
ncbi:isoprenylcysteine carboxylmethyltransferase family protein [uncultured Chitinophaga sp.]|uniref:isoprenylcysteine carboxyl methyltransferase family protein n=1 Tax=uncultured Chitinophaga sp. TaxID=339340 RepID=UPI002607862B|nr:isoprenylcysteine carboxylmethyltransferase family protein [uncultured Chitinophaga sp.]